MVLPPFRITGVQVTFVLVLFWNQPVTVIDRYDFFRYLADFFRVFLRAAWTACDDANGFFWALFSGGDGITFAS
jgi:hypothetical protein